MVPAAADFQKLGPVSTRLAGGASSLLQLALAQHALTRNRSIHTALALLPATLCSTVCSMADALLLPCPLQTYIKIGQILSIRWAAAACPGTHVCGLLAMLLAAGRQA